MSSIQLKCTEHEKKKKRQGKNKAIETNSKVTNMELINKNFKTLIINMGKDVKI